MKIAERLGGCVMGLHSSNPMWVPSGVGLIGVKLYIALYLSDECKFCEAKSGIATSILLYPAF